MSYAAERWARAQTVGDARAKQVLIELAHCMNSRTGLCNPGREYLHVVTELKLSTISAATTRLEQLGFIRKIGSKGVSLRYEFPKFDPEEWKESKDETGLGTESYSVQNRTRGEAETVPTTKAETVPRVGPKPAHKQGNNKEQNRERNKESSMRTSGNSSAIAAVASAQAQTPYPDDFDQSLFDEAQREAQLAGEKTTDEPPMKEEKPKRKRSSNVQKPESVSEQVWNDFTALRTKRRAPITETALKGIQREAEKAGITLEEALSTCCERGWQGFKAEWYRREKLEQKNASKAEYQLPSNDDWDNFDTAHYA